jgi:hypothetical protein
MGGGYDGAGGGQGDGVVMDVRATRSVDHVTVPIQHLDPVREVDELSRHDRAGSRA